MFIQEIELDSSRLLRNEIKKWHVVLNLSGILKSSFLKYLRHLQKIYWNREEGISGI